MACKRWRAKPLLLPIMPNLSNQRVQRTRIFENVGLDYLGPLSIKCESGLNKRWIALFTCFTTRAIHLEVVDDLSAESFMHVLRRFGARRGYPYPNGGVYERLIGLTKNDMRRSIGRRLLRHKELITLMAEIEGVLNSRPLTYVNFDEERTQRHHKSPKLVEEKESHEQEIVLLNEPNIPRGVWKIAKAKELKRGRDGEVRNVIIETPQENLLNRPVNMLYPLEVGNDESQKAQISEPEKSTQQLKPQEELIAARTRSATQKQNTQTNFYTRTHIRLPGIKCNNITRTVCTKAFLRLSLSVASDKTTISATSSHLCINLDNEKELNGTPLKQISPNKCTTNNNV
ncbi:unnamed protein product [Acanthocheilonema viteae]|uniref:DUF5641 domain-containing protein n=1 Tax=Acanthocheilonema viteae TaxID=6277 RepID=A0A498SK97_ACAVI|nr:unnamed protein product [Acanthocheilonema viteae]